MREATVWFTATRQEPTAPARSTIAAGPVGAPELRGKVIMCTVTRPRAATPLRPVTYVTARHCAVFRYPASSLSPRLPRFPTETRSATLGARGRDSSS